MFKESLPRVTVGKPPWKQSGEAEYGDEEAKRDQSHQPLQKNGQQEPRGGGKKLLVSNFKTNGLTF